MGTFVRGLGIGLAIAAPVGPIGVLCIRRSIAFGRVTGLVTGLGAATADACYAAVAAFGLTAAADALARHATPLRVGGGIFLIALAIRTMRAAPAEQRVDASHGLAAAYASSVALTLTNPTTILSFAAAYAGLGMVGDEPNTVTGALIVGGVFGGSAAWWVVLSWVSARIRLDPSMMRWVNRISGAVIGVFGILAIAIAL